MHRTLYTGSTTAWTPKGPQVVAYEVVISDIEVEQLAKKAAAGSGKSKSGPVVVRITSRKAVVQS